MDIASVVGKFFDEKGNITLSPQFTLAAMCEMVYQADAASGGADRHCLRYWDYSESREGVAHDYTRTDINRRIKAVAARLQQIGKLGDRVAILSGNCPEYLYAFLGAMYAGMTPIPLYDPAEPGHAEHLQAVFGSAKPQFVATSAGSAAAVRRQFASVPASERPRILSIESIPDALADQWTNPMTTPEYQQYLVDEGKMPVDTTAFLQYTSGSTRTPTGVILSHRNIITNVLQIFTGAQLQPPLRMAFWLPLHHDMGMILAAFATILGLEFELMKPRDFVQQPSRWIKQLNKRDDGLNIYTVIPNFALELAARYAVPAEGEELDLSGVKGIVVSSEPVTMQAVTNFIDTFKPYGLPDETVQPAYGLAEAALLVTIPQTGRNTIFQHFDREALAGGKAVLLDGPGDNAASFISNGQVVQPQWMIIADPETGKELPDGQIGEIWALGENVAQGYANRPEETEAVFGNRPILLEENSRGAGAPADARWLATGDMGVIVDNEIYLTGRLKDLIVIAGRNHYPQDIEYTVEHASEHVRPAGVAAFAIPGDDVEKLVIFAERDEDTDESGDAVAIDAIRTAVTHAHGVRPHDVRIVAPDQIKRSSSHKIARRVMRGAYLAGEFDA